MLIIVKSSSIMFPEPQLVEVTRQTPIRCYGRIIKGEGWIRGRDDNTYVESHEIIALNADEALYIRVLKHYRDTKQEAEEPDRHHNLEKAEMIARHKAELQALLDSAE